jgi:hypothetical protein
MKLWDEELWDAALKLRCIALTHEADDTIISGNEVDIGELTRTLTLIAHSLPDDPEDRETVLAMALIQEIGGAARGDEIWEAETPQ